MRKRMSVKPVPQIGVMDKRFKPVADVSKKIDVTKLKPHPLIVISDLKKGVVTSLVKYIAEEQKIDDLEILLWLVYLLAGSPENTNYRLLSVEHPELASKRGRKRNPKPALTEREAGYVEAYDTEYSISVKHTAAIAYAASVNHVGWRTIEQAVRKRKKIQECAAPKREKSEFRELVSKMYGDLAERKNLRW